MEHEPLPPMEQLTSRPIPDLSRNQLARFRKDTLHTQSIERFDPISVQKALQTKEGQQTIAIDIGGSKVSVGVYTVIQGTPKQIEHLQVQKSREGKNILPVLEHTAKVANDKKIPVGISIAGPVEKTRLNDAPNLPAFLQSFGKYDRDFANLFDTVTVFNDAITGLQAATLAALKNDPDVSNVIFFINGSGIGGAVYKSGRLYAAEPGHIEASRDLNPFGANKACRMFGNEFICIENISGGKPFIENEWRMQTGEMLTGEEICKKYMHGNDLAKQLYDASAIVSAHTILGIAKVFGLPFTKKTAVVCHGGTFQIPGYGPRVEQLAEAYQYNMQFLFTKDLFENACLDGAAIAALTV